MNAKQALAVLSYYEDERASAHSSGMDWMPSSPSRQEITDALAAIWASERVSLAQKEAADVLDPWAYHRPDGSLQVSDE